MAALAQPTQAPAPLACTIIVLGYFAPFYRFQSNSFVVDILYCTVQYVTCFFEAGFRVSCALCQWFARAFVAFYLRLISSDLPLARVHWYSDSSTQGNFNCPIQFPFLRSLFPFHSACAAWPLYDSSLSSAFQPLWPKSAGR